MKTNENKVKPIFKNRILEAFTWTNFGVHLLWYGGLSAGLFLIGLHYAEIPIVNASLLFILGLFFWTFAEYAMHRYLFHFVSELNFIRRLKYIFHGIHHEFPREEKRTLMPPIPGLVIVSIYFLLGYVLIGMNGAYAISGFVLGYTFYSCLHYSIHIFTAPKFLQHLWTHHLIHHYQQPEKAFGVTTRVWDRVFHSMPEMTSSKKTN
jgi:sterol desaturase/sphingolipid hydroxylase (fatty acid hydroxylase superfamily)